MHAADHPPHVMIEQAPRPLILQRVAGIVDLSIREVTPIPAADYPAKTARPTFSVLDNTRFDERFGLHRPQWSDGLALVLAELFDA